MSSVAFVCFVVCAWQRSNGGDKSAAASFMAEWSNGGEKSTAASFMAEWSRKEYSSKLHGREEQWSRKEYSIKLQLIVENLLDILADTHILDYMHQLSFLYMLICS